MLNAANPAPRTIMMRIGSQPCMIYPRGFAPRAPPRACESFLNRSIRECYHNRFQRVSQGPSSFVLPREALPRHDVGGGWRLEVGKQDPPRLVQPVPTGEN